MVDTDQPLSQLHMVQAARRYYLDDASKVQIADELGISRFKVARLLEAAKHQGIVRIEVVEPGTVRDKLSQELVNRFRLDHALVVDLSSFDDDAARRSELGRAAADLLTRILQPTDVIGLPWSRMVAETVQHFDALPPIPIVQLSGALDLPANATSPVDIVRDAARVTGGEAHVFYAPLATSSAEAATIILQQPGVAGSLAEAKRCSVALVGVGGWTEHESTLFDLATQAERDELASHDIAGEIAGTFLDTRGHVIEASLSSRLVTIPAKHLRRIPQVIAVAQGATRAAAFAAGICGGFVDSAVVDRELAEALLALDGDARPETRAS